MRCPFEWHEWVQGSGIVGVEVLKQVTVHGGAIGQVMFAEVVKSQIVDEVAEQLKRDSSIIYRVPHLPKHKFSPLPVCFCAAFH